MLDYSKFDDPFSYVPPHTRDGIKNYIEYGYEPGSFLSSLICNDLKETLGRADETNARHIKSIVAWFYNYAPSDCWGSELNYKAWIQSHNSSREMVGQ